MKWPIKKIKYFDEDLHYIWLTVSTCYAHICGKYMYLQQMNDPLLLMNWKGVHARRKCVIRLIKLYIYSVLKMQDENYTWHKIDSHLWVFCIYAVFFLCNIRQMRLVYLELTKKIFSLWEFLLLKMITFTGKHNVL